MNTINEWLAALDGMSSKKFFWDYFNQKKTDGLNRISSKMMTFSESVKYPVGKNWVQGSLFFMPPGRSYIEILSLDTKGIYKFYDKTEKRFVETTTLTKEFVALAANNA